MFQLSTNPTIQQQQLQELLKESEHYLSLLTSPIDFRYGQQLEEPTIPLYDKRETVFDYTPPSTRFAKFGNNHYTSLDFE